MIDEKEVRLRVLEEETKTIREQLDEILLWQKEMYKVFRNKPSDEFIRRIV